LNIDIINTEINKKCFFCDSLDSTLKLKIHDAPLVLGCTTQTVNIDKLISYNVFKCKFCGLVFTDIDLDLEAYSQIHSEAVGKIWHEHHESFSKFVNFKRNSGIRLEIGPSNNPILRKNTVFIDMFEKSPFNLFENENYLKGKFPNITLKKKFKTIVASHVFEHSTNPEQFLNKCKNILDDDGNIFLSIPNFEIWINEKYWNGITAEHQIYPTITQIKKICKKLNLHPIFEHFQNHSIFIRIIKGDFIDDNIPYDLDVIKWAESIKSSIYAVEKTLIEKQVEDLFIIGASHLSQYPIMISKEIKNRIKFVLDNSPNKHGKRLYGTTRVCKSFDVISDFKKPCVLLFNSPYRKEMIEQIKIINNDSTIIYE
jgi:SAM-dependent methyltransferase